MSVEWISHTKDDDIIIRAKTEQKLNANLWAVRGVIGTNDAMQDTISDLLFHHDIRKVVGGRTPHLGIRMVPQVAVCWNFFLKIVLGARQNQWRCAIWLWTHKNWGSF